MSLRQNLSVKLGQRLSMTPQLRQAIEILQLGQLDLTQFLEEEVEKNPLLELQPPKTSVSSTGGGDSQFDPIDLLSAEVSLIDHLAGQISLMDSTPDIAQLALRLTGELNENGYLDTPVFELADRLNASTAQVETALDLVQACEPVGIGARDLQECLKLQLIDQNRFDPIMQKVLENLHLVAKNDTKAMAEIIQEGGPETAEILTEIRQLNPRPAAQFGNSPLRESRPDVRVKSDGMGSMRVELVTSALPRLLVNHEYAAEIASKDDKALIFAHDCEQSANWLIKALDQRAQTILKAATAVVQHQHAFFSDGPRAMLPLTLAEIADSISVHESTVSRAINGKYLICDRGVFDLKYFFATKILSIDGNRDFSSVEIRSRIKALIGEENHKKPLSDDRIVKILRSDGVDIARRTIAKYRESMSIPSSVNRRKINLKN